MKQQLSQSFELMDENSEILKYGYGIMLLGDYFGHSGQTFGFQAYVGISEENDDIYVIGINDASISSRAVMVTLYITD